MKISQPPTLFGGYRQGEGWTRVDYALVEAYQRYTEDLHKCGYPWWMCSSEEIIGEVSRDWVHCFICEKADADTKDEGVEPGDHMVIRNELFKKYAPKYLRRLMKATEGV